MFLFTILSWVIAGVVAEERPLVNTTLGDLIGTWRTSAQGKQYAAFTAVPYAKPPVGERRFEPPQELKGWFGVWDAGTATPECSAFMHMIGAHNTKPIVGQEDCLYLNVYTPRLPSQDPQELLPVIVYFHGGAFMFGTGSTYGPKFLVDRDLVVITANYRLGPLGFLTLDDPVQPGNNGLRDQVLVLHWIQKHISAFSGDPNSVTITGGSAGGASVQYHYLSPMSQGLFARGISSSGTSLCRWALTDKAREKSLQLAASVGCPTDKGARHVIQCLKQRPAERILEKVAQFQVWQYSPFSPFGPVVESVRGDAPTFLPDWPVRLLQRGDFKRAPWMTGVTTAEGMYPAGAFVANEEELALLERDFTRLIPHLLDFNMTLPQSQHEEVCTAIKQHYLGDQPVNSDTVPQLIKMIGDRLFVVDAQRAAELHGNYSPVYFYVFGFRGSHSLSDIMTGTKINFGVSHADDTAYLLNMTFITDEPQGMEKQVQNLWLDLWSSFARTGVPKSGDVQWTTVQGGGGLEVLHIDGVPPVMTSVADLGDATFWESLPLHEPQQTFITNKDEL